ncbi:pectate lyase family protein [Formosa haliotis]|uniref:pectate lyase family protein n=1 Tax=Formosa haliotis TaxID=1555194 RepID=UPI00082680AC|nr:T9SS type A sorting domain-containing protein [Formosa haliotis]
MFKKTLIYTIFLLFTVLITAQNVTIIEYGGWLESAFIKWSPVEGADSYNVYYTGEGITNRKIDDQLIRCYSDFNRADLIGLKEGTYTISVAAITNGKESPLTTSSNISIKAHDRTGFAFSNGRIPGGYNLDGTPKPEAVIIYVSENNKDTIELNVTGANANPCVGLQEILSGFKKGKDFRPLIIRLIGQVTDLAVMDKGDIVIENNNEIQSSITLEGVGDDSTVDGWGIRIKNASNIEIRNIGTMNCDSNEGDNIGLQQNNQYIWVHNVDFFYGSAGGDSDQTKGDGALDCKKSTYVTFSYNHFWDSGKANLLGLSENTTENLYITYHHNWYDHSDSRHPRVRFYSAHVYNNYYDGNSKYGIGSTLGSSVFSESNYFRNCKYPMLTSMQGSDVYNENSHTNDYDNSPTFSKEDGGTIKAFNNYIESAHRFVAYGNSDFPSPTIDFDAYLVANRNDKVPNSVLSAYGGNTYNNFDTNNEIMYSYIPDSPAEARDNVILYSGRVNGGDIKFSFNNAVDDKSYAVNLALKSLLTNYTTSLICIQGEQGLEPEITVTATPGDSFVKLDWMVNNYTPSTYDIYRHTSSNPSARIKLATIEDSKTLSYTDYNVTNDTEYYYWIKADSSIESKAKSAIPSAEIMPSSGEIHNFTESGINSSFYTISGNLSTSKGTVNYNSLTLTQCLKMESVTSIKFKTTTEGTLTLVFNDGESNRVKINGINNSVINGILQVDLDANSEYEITKGDTMNLFYMSVVDYSLGIVDSEIKSLKLYPNPVRDNLFITSSSNIEKIEIYSIQGALVLKKSAKDIKIINLNTLKTGTYLIKMYSNQKTIDKILLKH